jgi:4-carboxymuconolactone decarboxylase
MTRIPTLTEAQLTAEQRRVFDLISAGPRGAVRGPLLTWLHSPQLAEHAQALGLFCRYGTSLPPRLVELAILTTAQHWQAPFEWRAHVPHALEAGISRDVIDALEAGVAPRFERPDEAAIHRFASELLQTRAVSDLTYQLALDAVGSVSLVELIGVLGYYGLIAMTLKVFDAPHGPTGTNTQP